MREIFKVFFFRNFLSDETLRSDMELLNARDERDFKDVDKDEFDHNGHPIWHGLPGQGNYKSEMDAVNQVFDMVATSIENIIAIRGENGQSTPKLGP